MNIVIAYPPLSSEKGVPLLGQNRQFQWFSHKSFIFPLVPASAATLLKSKGYRAFWLDGIAECWTYEEWEKEVRKIKPDIIFLESKTPVIKRHWQIINDLKKKFPKTKVVLAGDHVTALPEESMKNSKVDFIITGGDYDFLLLNITNHLSRKEKLEPGIWYRSGNKIRSTGQFQLNHDLETLPFIDRELTRWRMYGEKLLKRKPATYTMAGRDCWWRANGGCAFCAWTTLYPKFRTRSPQSLLDEIGILIEKYGVKEIFDDTGTIPYGKWLKDFCQGMIKRGYHKKISLGCNARVVGLDLAALKLMKKAGFRFMKVGFESANAKTLKKIGKGITTEDIKRTCRLACQAGINIHLTVMIGYPWETEKDARHTLKMAKSLFDRGWADTLQATVVIPYPGTRLFAECKEKKWLKTVNWDNYDMSMPVMRSPISDEAIMEMTRGLLKSFITPKYILRKISEIRSPQDVLYYFQLGRAVLGHILNFSRQQNIKHEKDS